jgi:hypothetical protein
MRERALSSLRCSFNAVCLLAAHCTCIVTHCATVQRVYCEIVHTLCALFCSVVYAKLPEHATVAACTEVYHNSLANDTNNIRKSTVYITFAAEATFSVSGELFPTGSERACASGKSGKLIIGKTLSSSFITVPCVCAQKIVTVAAIARVEKNAASEAVFGPI